MPKESTENEKTKELNLLKHRKAEIARQLAYPLNAIRAIYKAKDADEVNRILIDARKGVYDVI